MLHVCVSDNGKGIEKSEQREIFQKFGKLLRTAAMNSEGIGLGLTISKSLAEANGGDLRVASRGVDLGAHFMFAMKMTISEDDEQSSSQYENQFIRTDSQHQPSSSQSKNADKDREDEIKLSDMAAGSQRRKESQKSSGICAMSEQPSEPVLDLEIGDDGLNEEDYINKLLNRDYKHNDASPLNEDVDESYQDLIGADIEFEEDLDESKNIELPEN